MISVHNVPYVLKCIRNIFNGDVGVAGFAFLPVAGGVGTLHADAEFVAFGGGIRRGFFLLLIIAAVVGALSSGRDAETGQKKPGADFQKVLEAFLQVEEPYER